MEGLFLESFVVEFIKSVRLKDTGIGGGKFWQMCRNRFGEKLSLGYNRFYDIIELQIPQQIFSPAARFCAAGVVVSGLRASWHPFRSRPAGAPAWRRRLPSPR